MARLFAWLFRRRATLAQRLLAVSIANATDRSVLR